MIDALAEIGSGLCFKLKQRLSSLEDLSMDAGDHLALSSCSIFGAHCGRAAITATFLSAHTILRVLSVNLLLGLRRCGPTLSLPVRLRMKFSAFSAMLSDRLNVELSSTLLRFAAKRLTIDSNFYRMLCSTPQRRLLNAVADYLSLCERWQHSCSLTRQISG